MLNPTVLLLFTAICLLSGCGGSVVPTAEETESWIQKQIAKLDRGAKEIYLYSTVNTDRLLERVAGRVEVERMILEDTDVSSGGMRHLSSLPNLKKLSFNWAKGSDEDIAAMLANCEKLKRLEVGNKNLAGRVKSLIPDCEVSVHWKITE